MMQTDVKSAYASGAGDVQTGRTRLKGVVIVPGATDGAVNITNGSGGASLFQINTKGGTAAYSITFPGEGIVSTVGLYVTTLSNCPCVVMFYG